MTSSTEVATDWSTTNFWEYDQWPHEVHGHLSEFDFTQNKLVWAGANPLLGVGPNTNSSLINPDYRDFAPRGGLAYQLSPKTTFRMDYAEAYNNLGVALADTNRLEDAAASFQKAAGLKPAYADPHYNLGLVALVESKPGAAVPALRKAVALKPGSAEYHYRLGLALSQAGDAKPAAEELRAALRLDADNGPAHYSLARQLARDGDQAGAAQEFAAVARIRQSQQEKDLRRTQAILEIGRGLDAMAVGDIEDAVREFNQASHTDPSSPEAHNHLGVALAKQGRNEAAMAEFRQVLELQPQNAPARNNEASLLARQGNLTAAVEQLQKAIALQDDMGEAHHNLGILLLQEGKQKAGEAELAKAREGGRLPASPPR